MTQTLGDARRLNGILRSTKATAEPADPPETPVVERLIRAFLTWETTTRQADQAYNRLMRRVVDFNDMRVTDLADLVEAIGPRVSRAEERALRIRHVLHAIYEQEHAVSLERYRDLPKREARKQLDEMTGMVPFVSASVVLLALGGHAMPVDDQLLGRLKRDGVVDEEATLDQVVAFLEYQVPASDNLKAYARLRKYAEQGAPPAKSAKKKTTRKKTTKKKTTRKKTTKKKTTRR